MNWRLLGNSVLVSATTTLVACLFGLCVAVCVAGLPMRARKWGIVVSVLALMLPPFVATNCWIHLLGANGVWRGWLPLNIYSIPGVVWVLALIYWPITLLLVLGAWQKLERAYFEADPALRGASLVRWLLLPAARPALAQAALITFVLALNHFAVPAILQVKVFPAEIWLRLSSELDYAGAWVMSVPLIAISLGALLLLRRREIPWPAKEGAAPAEMIRMQLGPLFWFCVAATILVTIFSVIIPLAQIALDAKAWRELPAVFRATAASFRVSLLYAGIAATACAVLAALFWRWRFGWCLWILFLTPGVLIGTALIYVFNRPVLDAVYHSAGMVIIALTARFVALNWQAAHVAMQRADRDILDVVRLETGSRWRLFWTGYWPQTAATTFAAAWFVTYLVCLWEVETLVMIYPPGGETLALRIFNLLHYGHIAQVNALCLLLLGLAMLPLLLWALFRSSKFAGR